VGRPSIAFCVQKEKLDAREIEGKDYLLLTPKRVMEKTRGRKNREWGVRVAYRKNWIRGMPEV